jgi:hypothetical protein
VNICEGVISQKSLRGEPTCSDVSLSNISIPYTSDDTRILSFAKDTDFIIYRSKSADSRPDLSGADLKGFRGYVPKIFVREWKIL